MMEDIPGPDLAPAADGFQAMVEAAAETASHGVDAAVETSTAATEKAADFVQDIGERGEEAYATASAETAQAFEQARGWLQGMGVPGLEAGQAMFDPLKFGTNDMSRRFIDGYGRTAQAMAEINAKAVDVWRTNAEATIAHWQSIAAVTSWSKMIALNTAKSSS